MSFLDQFNDTQIKILDLMLKGKTPKEISFETGKHIQTCYNAMNVIYLRFGIENRNQYALIRKWNELHNLPKTR